MVVRAVGMCALAAVLVTSTRTALAQAPQLSVPDRVAALKTTLAASQANLRHYDMDRNDRHQPQG
jgi:hypothetical protein